MYSTLGVRQYKCMKCYYIRNKSDVKVHINKVHLGQIFTCVHCNYVLRSNSNLIEHMKRKHPDVLLSCDLCNYQTSLKASLIYHKAQVHHITQTSNQEENQNPVDDDIPNVIEYDTWKSYYTKKYEDGKKYCFIYIMIK